MRSFGLIGVLVALAIVGWLVKKQVAPTPSVDATGAAVVAPAPKQQVQDYQQSLNKALEQGAAARASEATQ